MKMTLITLVSVFLAQPGQAQTNQDADQLLSPAEAIAMWSIVKWGHQNCPEGTLNPIHYRMVAGVEDNVPKDILKRAEVELPPLFIAKTGSKDAACAELENGWKK